MQTNQNNYYDIEFDFEGIMLESGMVEEMFYLKDLKQRKLFLNEGINQSSIAEVVKHIMQYNCEDKGIPSDERKSMGFLIGLAGHKRYATKNAKFLMHDGSNFIYDSGAKAQDRMRFDSRVEERTKAYILSRGNLTSEEYDAKFRVEWYMFADEAKERGFVDYIIGEDCDIDEVI